ncbi:cobalt-zinc-cadmium resistance protein [Liquorilactobacillus sucicola DSM 21376 = JCM 15457]|uniref:Cation efflux transporter n=1 Tax=Liquorilactobacillus sucicola DSM 21376 = JCM 15457 TaxID=1423806 RepID=A0A023CU28_9LACO|nr:cation diffusion facilitator family transporter [Liquorilactobacillus sucicola]KRN05190.1 cation efflux transporter [Liquorilactobacillus sucicola DSM 21376 = JCM 15457]GAJ25244.1 cobalt-zinc-cadmium resistance protein [Liquorilactobacillus sucicola DSM 21376 = JCM 15457]
MQQRYQNLKIAQRGVIVSLAAYITLSLLKIIIGQISHSEALLADGSGNVTDIFSSCAIMIGLRLAQRPPDENHQYGHWRAETLATLITSFIMLLVGLSVLYSSVSDFIAGNKEVPDIYALFVGLFSGCIMFGVYLHNSYLAKKINSDSLLAIAKDTRNDALTSLATSITIIGANFKMPWLDSIVALLIGLTILKTAYNIFSDSAFSLSDGFDDELLAKYTNAVNEIPGVELVHNIQGRSYGANIFVDIIIWVDPQMSVRESHHITEKVESLLRRKFGVLDTDVHVEPWDVDYELTRPNELNSH